MATGLVSGASFAVWRASSFAETPTNLPRYDSQFFSNTSQTRNSSHLSKLEEHFSPRQIPRNLLSITHGPDQQRPSLRSGFRRDEPSSDRQTLHKWMQSNLIEIVKGLQDAPMVHLVFNTERSGGESQYVVKGTESWSEVRDSILKVEPDGVIIVERVENSFGEEEWSDVWGVMVQGKSIACNACYILKTCRVESCCSACTRFCLTKATCFGPSIPHQIQSTWLLP